MGDVTGGCTVNRGGIDRDQVIYRDSTLMGIHTNKSPVIPAGMGKWLGVRFAHFVIVFVSTLSLRV